MPIVFDPLLESQLLGIKLPSPIMVGSGPLTDSLGRIKKYFNAGAGAVIGKTIYLGKESEHVEKVQVSHAGLFNSTTYSKKNPEEWLQIFHTLDTPNINIFPSIHAETPDMLGMLAAQIEPAKCKLVELGIACPNDGSQQKINPQLIFDYTHAVKKRLKTTPIIVKLAAVDGYLDTLHAAIEAGASAISLSDTLPSIVFDVHKRHLIFDGPAGYSGPAIKPIVLHAIYQARKAGIRCPIIGIGGIQSADDVLEYLHVGANAIQIYTALMMNSHHLIHTMNHDLASWCQKNGETIHSLTRNHCDE